MFVLLNWAYEIYTICVKQNENFPTSLAFKALVGSMALLLDMVLESSKSKDTLKKGAVVRARRALRSVSTLAFVSFMENLTCTQSGSTIPVVISTLLALVKANASQNPIRFFTLVGVAVAVLVRQKHVPTSPEDRLSKELQVSPSLSLAESILTRGNQTEISTIYTSTILMSRAAIPPHILVCFNSDICIVVLILAT